VTIAEETLTGYINSLFGYSSPGDTLHHLLIASAAPGSLGPLGVLDSDALKVTAFVIAPDESVESTERFVDKVIIAAAVEARKEGRVIHFAGLTIEAHTVQLPEDVDERVENLARRLDADGKLEEHPNAIEVTTLYAACGDGRRWVGTHYLTGPEAGRIEGPDLRVGGLAHDERRHHQRMLRKLVMGARSM